MNKLREKDFVKVPPGGTFDPYQHIDDQGFFSAHELSPEAFRAARQVSRPIHIFHNKRRHRCVAWPPSRETASDQKLGSMFEMVPNVEIRSNEIEITVVAGSAS